MENKKIIIILFIIIILLVFIFLFKNILQKTGDFSTKTPAFVSRIIDGDTIELENKEQVRLLGINTPEKGELYYIEATKRLKELVGNKTVFLENDIQSEDKYGRLLRYVYIDNIFVNFQLVKDGYAHVYVISPNNKYEKELREAEKYARNSGLNIWSTAIIDKCIGIGYFHWDAEGNDCTNPNDEYVTIINNCSDDYDMKGWTVKDDATHIFTFPSFILKSNSQVTLYNGCGINSDTEIYWCFNAKCKSIWNNDGDTLYLRNLKGELVLSYSYTN